MYIKSSENVTDFFPTRPMIKWADTMVNPEVSYKITDIARACSVTQTEKDVAKWRRRWYRWEKKPHFYEWLDSYTAKERFRINFFLDKIGLMRASQDYRYWKIMTEKYDSIRV